jgi:hypothetical protein
MRISVQDLWARDRDRLGEILISANVKRNKKLYEYLETWLAVRPDVTAWRRSNPKLAKLLDTTLASVRWTPIFRARVLEPTAQMKRAEERAKGLLKESSEGYKRYWGRPPISYAILRGIPDPPAILVPEIESLRPKRMAAWLFWQLLSNPAHDQLFRCERCKLYFVSIRRRARSYCDHPECRSRGSAKKTMDALRKREQAEKIAICEELRARCPEQVKIEGNWRRWVSEQSKPKKHVLTVTWITRALNQGRLRNA